MKRFLLLFGLVSFLTWATPVRAATNVCNKTCQVNEDCGQGYRCYVGICRTLSCPSSPNCQCAVAAPTPTPAPDDGVENLRVRLTPSPKTAAVVAPNSIKSSPTTGVDLSLYIFGAVGMGLTGLVLKKQAKRA